jgi:hypothetical protein
MDNISKLGTYKLDLFTVASGQNLEDGVPDGVWTTNGTNDVRDIRLVALRLSDFGLNSSNFNLVKKLKIRPSGTSDIAFIGYNANAIKALLVITRKSPTTDTIVCIEGDAAVLAVNVSSSYDDILTYQWQKKIDTSWVDLTNTSKYVGASTKTLTINYDSDTTVDFSLEKYRIKVVSSNAEDSSYSSQFKVSLAPTSCFLPVELLSFSYDCEKFIWETASENNSDYFSLESSDNGQDWEVEAIIPSAGNSTMLLTYEYKIDRITKNYYRLKQVDFNGEFKEYDPISPNCDSDLIITKPNPSNSEFSLLITSNNEYFENLIIYDMVGNILLRKTLKIKEGVNVFLFDEKLNNGLYLVKTNNTIIKHLIK